VSWRNRFGRSWRSVVKASRSTGRRVEQVAVQGFKQARISGAKLARRIVSIQRAANLHPRMMRQSVRSVANRSIPRESDRQWQASYVATAERLLAPRPAPPAPTPPAPTWPYKGGLDMSDPEIGQ